MRALTAAAAAATLTSALLLAGAPPAAADPVTVGQVSGNTGAGVCFGNATIVQTVSAGPSYVVPSSGVVTSIAYHANATPGLVRAVFFRPAAAANSWNVVGLSPAFAVTPGVLNRFAVRVPVQAGWMLGNWTSTNQMNCNGPTANTVDKQRAAAMDPATTGTLTSGTDIQAYRVNMAVVVEPDADGDGYGDSTQDRCLQLVGPQSGCPEAVTTVTKKPAKRSERRTQKITFTSSVPGSTFTCAVDGKRAKPCTSPFKKRYSYGRHVVRIAAVNPAGVADASPQKVRFKVLRPARR